MFIPLIPYSITLLSETLFTCSPHTLFSCYTPSTYCSLEPHPYKKVLLCEHKRHTTCHTASAHSAALSPDRREVPPSIPDRGYPYPARLGIPHWPDGYPCSLDGGTSHQPGGVPLLLARWGYPPIGWMGYPAPISTGWGSPQVWTNRHR